MAKPNLLLPLYLLVCLALNACVLFSRQAEKSLPPAWVTNSHSITIPSQISLPSSTPTASPPQPSPTVTPPPGTASPSLPLRVTSLPTQASACNQTDGRVEQHQLETTLLRLPLDFRLYLPPCYDQRPDSYYPVLYLIHGQSYTDDQWDRLGIDETASQLISSQEITPLIIVMPHDRLWLPPRQDNFGTALIQELIPWVDQNYRTLPLRPYRAIGGLSRGAGWAVHLGLSQWELFGAIGGHSLAIFNSDAPYFINHWLDSIPKSRFPRLYLDLGDHDRQEIVKSVTWFAEQLTKRSLPYELYTFPGYHEEAYWQSHLEQYLRWYTQNWWLTTPDDESKYR